MNHRTILAIALLIFSSLGFALTENEAAKRAQEITGGKVLQVKASVSGDYRVKVLMPNGQVRKITIKDNGRGINNKNPRGVSKKGR